MSATQDKIRLLNEEITKLKTIENHYQSSKKELLEAQKEFEKLEHKLNDEYADIEALEKLTLKGVFHSILGDKKKQLEAARQEYLQVALKHNELKTTIETLNYELSILQKKSDMLKQLQTEQKGLQKIREKELRFEDSVQGEQLRIILKSIDTNIEESNRLEAIESSGKKALKKLSLSVLALQEAKNWGNWDMMQKRHRMGDFYKHGAIDDAKKYAFDAKRALINFQRELGEIDMHLNTKEFDMSSMSSFLDIFFDNLITDWIFQQKIKKTLTNINIVIEDIKIIIGKLDQKQRNLESDLSGLLLQKEKILIS